MVAIKNKSPGFAPGFSIVPRVYLVSGCSLVEREDRWRGDLDGPCTNATTRARPRRSRHECLNILPRNRELSNSRRALGGRQPGPERPAWAADHMIPGPCKRAHRLTEVVEAEGHLIDSQILNVIFDTVVKATPRSTCCEFTDRPHQRRAVVRSRCASPGPTRPPCSRCSKSSWRSAAGSPAATTRPRSRADKDGCVPDDFYSTTNHRTLCGTAAMDRGRAAADGRGRSSSRTAAPLCRKLRDVRTGDAVVCGVDGIRVMPEFQERDRHGFAFMTNEISSERRVEVGVVAHRRDDARDQGGRRPHRGRRRPGRRAHRRRRRISGADPRRLRRRRCSPATRSPSTTSSRRSSAPRSASISKPARRSKAAIAITCARSTRSAAPAACARRSSRAC